MALTYTERRNLYGQLTNDSTTENLAFGDTLMNESEKRIVNTRAWDFTQRLHTDTTVASQQFYNLPVNYRRLIGKPTINSGDILYIPSETPDRQTWDRLNSVSFTSDIPQWFIIFNKQIGFYPIPSAAGQTITVPYEIQASNLTIADYSTGSITDATFGSTTIEGTGTSWTSAMAGRYIRITADNTTSSGDGEWYEIASVTDADTLELTIPYEGSTFFTATQPYTLAERTILPDGYDLLPIYDACEKYFIKTLEAGKADRYNQEFAELLRLLEKDHSQKTSQVALDEVGNVKNPNIFVRAT